MGTNNRLPPSVEGMTTVRALALALIALDEAIYQTNDLEYKQARGLVRELLEREREKENELP